MGFKRRKRYEAHGWIPKHEASVEQIRLGAGKVNDPAEELLVLNEHALEPDVKYRRVRAVVEIEVEEQE